MALLDAAEAAYGTEGTAALVRHAADYADVGRWLELSLGITPSEIEPLWREKVAARIATQQAQE